MLTLDPLERHRLAAFGSDVLPDTEDSGFSDISIVSRAGHTGGTARISAGLAVAMARNDLYQDESTEINDDAMYVMQCDVM